MLPPIITKYLASVVAFISIGGSVVLPSGGIVVFVSGAKGASLLFPSHPLKTKSEETSNPYAKLLKIFINQPFLSRKYNY